jgi:predicted RNA binding protein YcfA (HicA-like mRNA interferase family)
MTAREVVAALKAAGWLLVRTKGSHAQYRHPTKPDLVTVPMHPGDLPIGTLKSIERAAGIKLRR